MAEWDRTGHAARLQMARSACAAGAHGARAADRRGAGHQRPSGYQCLLLEPGRGLVEEIHEPGIGPTPDCAKPGGFVLCRSRERASR